MFNLIKQQVNLIEVLEKDLSVSFKQMGGKNWVIDGGKDIEACPFCNHHDCFRVSYSEDDGDCSSAFYKCFSCGEYGDVITWRSKESKLTMAEAARKLAEEYNIQMPTDHNPVQEIFTLAATYYHNCLMETCNRPYPALNGLTPIRYQTEVRKHEQQTLIKYKIGFSDGNLISYLDSLGIAKGIVEKSGLMGKGGKDFLPAYCFIYPHFVNGRVSHFTFKDPTKKLQFQLPKKYSLNKHIFYGQDSVKNKSSIALVEGENDWLSVIEAGGDSVLCTIGQLSGEQLDWLRETCKDKHIITLFDPDEAGDLYREKIQALRRVFKGLVHIKPPEDKDIDDNLKNGLKFEEIFANNQVTVKEYNPNQKKPVAAQPWDNLFAGKNSATDAQVKSNEESENNNTLDRSDFPIQLKEGMTLVGPSTDVSYKPPADLGSDDFMGNSEVNTESSYDDVVQIDDTSVIMTKNCYYKIVYKENVPTYVRLSDFTLELKNIILDEEEGDRKREVVIRRQDGYRSDVFEVDSATKVSSNKFKELMAKKADAEWTGRDPDLDGMWRLVYSQYPEVIIRIVHQVGRLDKYKCWIFKNLMITDSGNIIKPDENGVFWISGKNNGIKIKDITDDVNGPGGVPALYTELNREEADKLLADVLTSLGKNFTELGPALMAVGWVYANIYSNNIYRADGGFGPFMLWGVNGKGKSTIARWMQNFFGFTEKMGSTSIPRLVTQTGFLRQGAYYASLPLMLDEVRSDEKTTENLGMIRAWYDRESRVMAEKVGKNVRYVPIKSTLLMAGEDLPSDMATKERCIMIRVPDTDPNSDVMRKNYEFMTQNSYKFSNIVYFWLLDSTKEDTKTLIDGIRGMDNLLIRHGCSARISKVWSSAGYFANKLAKRFFADFNFEEYILKASTQEQAFQKSDNTIFKFFDNIDILKGRENSPITDHHIMRSGDKVHIWFSAVFKEVNDQVRNKEDKWSKHYVLRAIKEQPYFISDDRKVCLGLNGIRKTVLTLDLKLCPEPLRNAVNYTLPGEDNSGD